jgi:hypothetical protein
LLSYRKVSLLRAEKVRSIVQEEQLKTPLSRLLGLALGFFDLTGSSAASQVEVTGLLGV